ncbi:MAG TPA: DUF4102 domain-containing protein [Leucothrix mucor]|nr:DUF4102 domain-containing protein [Leucothrix mucor]
MALSDTALKRLKPKNKNYSKLDGRGLFIEVLKTKKIWRLRYRINGKQEKITFGEYPTVLLVEARKMREEARGLIAKGISPARHKQQAKREETKRYTVEDFANAWFVDVASKANKNPKTIKSALTNDVLPIVGHLKLEDVIVQDVSAVVDKIKARGSDH